MQVDYLHVSAFTSVAGQGNAAAVCQFERWPPDEQLVLIAREIAFPVTACIVAQGSRTELRWLSRAGTCVQSMCGHGTLAASCVMAMRHPGLAAFEFSTPGGPVPVRHERGLFYLSLPRWDSMPLPPDPRLSEVLGREPLEVHDAGRDTLAVFATESQVRALAPDMARLRALGRRGFIATAAGDSYDCVSRFFCPSFGIGVDEDPVTGSAHCSIAPFWAARLGKTKLRAYQASAAGGEVLCEVKPDAVVIGAPAVLCARGRIVV
jgi:predicted PhzF superfamily epimerase YddE/YHI9